MPIYYVTFSELSMPWFGLLVSVDVIRREFFIYVTLHLNDAELN